MLPLGKDGTRVTGSKEHITLSRTAATEGMVLLKNEQKELEGKEVVQLYVSAPKRKLFKPATE